ncbi:hypothetical protein DH2020_032014 [Rehmannia glutinosa]|uniref:Uncharacterized protein n=1 Tax=Rehmannia glutinosa TaxID=99300 RepID=A0ABR0VJU0_REHGL
MNLDTAISTIPDSVGITSYDSLELGLQESLSELGNTGYDDISILNEFRYSEALSEACNENLSLDVNLDGVMPTCPNMRNETLTESLGQNEGQSGEVVELASPVKTDNAEASSEYVSANDSHQSILVSFSSHCMVNGTVCERSRLLRIKFYGTSDKPLGRYLRDDLFDQSNICRSCKESAEAHVLCYTHQHANLTINVNACRQLSFLGNRMARYGCGTDVSGVHM